MSVFVGQRIWLVGASEGLGRALAHHLDAEGAELILSARNAERLDALCAELDRAQAQPVDVTDPASVRAARQAAGAIDHVIYMAGTYEPMRATSWDSSAALAMIDVNLSGALRVIGEVIDEFVQQGRGDITLVGSLAGYRGLPAAIGYGASKAGLISLAETMRHDLKGSGVRVRVISPGFIKTQLTAKNGFKMPMLMTAEKAAGHVARALKSKRLRTDFPAPFCWAIRVYDLLPDWLIYRGR